MWKGTNLTKNLFFNCYFLHSSLKCKWMYLSEFYLKGLPPEKTLICRGLRELRAICVYKIPWQKCVSVVFVLRDEVAFPSCRTFANDVKAAEVSMATQQQHMKVTWSCCKHQDSDSTKKSYGHHKVHLPVALLITFASRLWILHI